MNITITPNKLYGEVLIPGSKSFTHRALICAGLSSGRTLIHNPLYCDDTIMTINALKSFGVSFNSNSNYIEVIGIDEFKVKYAIEVGDSASTLRFLLPILSLYNDEFIIRGSRRLMERVNTSDLEKLIGLDIKVFDDYLHVKGKLDIEVININDSLTSQLISGILFTLPITKQAFKWNNISSPYVDMTIEMMKVFGIEFIIKDNTIHALNKYHNTEVIIESDYSSAAFFIAMAVLNKDIKIKGLNYQSIQGDFAIFDYLAKMGVVFNYGEELSIVSSNLKGITVDLTQTPDLVPIMAAIASVSKGRTVLTGLEKLVLKESNRIVSTYESLRSLGADIEIVNNNLIINGKDILVGGKKISSYRDHRIIMALTAISSRVSKPYTIIDAEGFEKSFPTFFKLYSDLGGLYES